MKNKNKLTKVLAWAITVVMALTSSQYALAFQTDQSAAGPQHGSNSFVRYAAVNQLWLPSDNSVVGSNIGASNDNTEDDNAGVNDSDPGSDEGGEEQKPGSDNDKAAKDEESDKEAGDDAGDTDKGDSGSVTNDSDSDGNAVLGDEDNQAADQEQATSGKGKSVKKAPAKDPVRAQANFDPNSFVSSDQIVDMAAKGIKVNLFDYGPTAIDREWSNVDPNNYRNNIGINEGKTLKFFQNGVELNSFGTNTSYWNAFTGSSNQSIGKGATANQGILKNTLGEDGYPQLAVGGKDSLAYLFDPSISLPTYNGESVKTTYENIQGLFRTSYDAGDSPYEVKYDSSDNYARLGSDNTFKLNTGTYYNGNVENGNINALNGPIGFFPFDDPNVNNYEVSGQRASANSSVQPYNHHFGMTMDADFALTDDRTLGEKPMVFEFSGDDDMWVFIDGVLVLDIGGIHTPVAGKIDFKEGTVSIEKAPYYDGQTPGTIRSGVQFVNDPGNRVQKDNNGKASYYYNTAGEHILLQDGDLTLAKIFELAGKEWSNEPYKKHRIQAFYLERGGMYSNLSMSMNLLMTKDLEITKAVTDENGDAIDDLDDYYVGEDQKYKFKVWFLKEGKDEDDPSNWYAYTGNADLPKGIHNFDGYDVYEGNTKVNPKPTFTDDGIIELKRSQRLVIGGVPTEQLYYIEECDINADEISGAVINKETTVPKPEDIGEDGKYSVETDKLKPAQVDTTNFSNKAIHKKGSKVETEPYEGSGDLGGVKPGDVITYRISYENTREIPQDLTITDKLDTNVEYVSDSASDGGVYDEGTHTITWTKEAVPEYDKDGYSGSVTFQVKVKESALQEGKVENKDATITIGNRTETVGKVTNPVTEPKKELVDRQPGDIVDPGDVLEYKIYYKNYKTEAADIVITDYLDPNVEPVSETGNPWTVSGNEATKTLTGVAAGAEGTVTIKVKVKESAQLEGKVENTGGVKVGNDKELKTNTIKNPVPNVVKTETYPDKGTGRLGVVNVSDHIRYSISYKNYKDDSATVTITDKLDPGVDFVSTGEGEITGTYNADSRTVTWTLENVPAGKEGTVELEVVVTDKAKTKGEVANTANVKVDNDKEYETNEVTNPVPEHKKTELLPYQGSGVLGAVKPGDTIEYKIDYKNYKTTAATITITDKLDPNVTYVDGSATDDGVYNENDHTLTWTIKDSAKESEGGVGEVANTANVKVDNDKEYETNEVTNPVPEDPVKTETEPYSGTGELGGVKPGQTIKYSISYKNYKDDKATVIITDKLDPNVEFVNNSASDGGVYDEDAHTLTWTLENVSAGQSGAVTLEVTVKETATSGLVNNKATLTVGNDVEFETNKVTNPITEVPHKEETSPDQGTGLLKGVSAGDEITYKISYKNYKPSAAKIKITDPLDPNVTYVEGSATNDGVYDEDAHTLTWTLENVPANGEEGSSGTVTFSVKVKQDVEGELIKNKANVQVGNDPSLDTEEVTNPTTTKPVKAEVTPGADVRVRPGDTITYQISYSNYHPEPRKVVITDKLDPNVTYVDGSATDDGVYNENDHTLTWTMGNDKDVETEPIKNPVPDDPVKTEDPHKQEMESGEDYPLKPGDDVTYRISYHNYKDETADITITDTLDEGLDFVSAGEGDNAGVYDKSTRTVTWNLKDVPADEKGIVVLNVKVNEKAKENDSTVTNKANVQVGPDPKSSIETNTIDNPIPDPRKVETEPYTGQGDVQVEDLEPVKPGDKITYKISYHNYKDEKANIKITDILDEGLDFVSAGKGDNPENSVDYDESTRTVTWNLKDVPAGENGTVELKVKVNEEKLGDVVKNKASVRVDDDPSFDTNTEQNPVPKDPEKTETAPYEGKGELGGVKPGEEITYKVSYKNYKADAANVVVTDTIDSKVEFVSASKGDNEDYCTEVKQEGNLVIWTFSDLPAGEEGEVELTVKVKDDVTGKIINSAMVNVANDQPFYTNTVTNPVPEKPGKEEVAVNDDTGEHSAVQPGDEITYEITYTNYKSTTTDVLVTDHLDPNVEFVSSTPERDPVLLDNDMIDNATGKDTVRWTIKDVPPGESGKISITVRVLPTALPSEGGNGNISNSAEVIVGEDSDFISTPVHNYVPEPPVKEEISPYKGTGELGEVKPGEVVKYQIEYTNYQPEAATVTITDKLDPNVEFKSASDGGTLNSEGEVVWTIDNVDAGAKGTVTLEVTVLDSATETGRIENSAKVKIGSDAELDTNVVGNPAVDDEVPPIDDDDPTGDDSDKSKKKVVKKTKDNKPVRHSRTSTGDDTPYGVMLSVMAASLLALIGLAVTRRFRRKPEDTAQDNMSSGTK